MTVFFKGVVLCGALLCFAGHARALELVQSEGPGLPFACVSVASVTDDVGTPVLAAACGYTFASFWQFQGEAIEGPGSLDKVVTCLSVDKSTKNVSLQPCNLHHLLPNEEWGFFDGLVFSFAFGEKTKCLDSGGNYTNKITLPTTAQLTVTPCSLIQGHTTPLSTQIWKLK